MREEMTTQLQSRTGRAARLLRTCAVAVLAFSSPLCVADIYKYVDPNGGVHLADRPLGPGYVLIFRNGRKYLPYSASGNYALNRKRYGPIVDRAANHHQLDASLVHAVVEVESAYDPRAISRKGAVGLMQLMPDTARRYGVNDPRDPAGNVDGGVRYLRDLILRFNNVILAIAAYNAGENAVARFGNTIPPYPETRRYVHKVMQAWKARLAHKKSSG